jgi:hypothetical protein
VVLAVDFGGKSCTLSLASSASFGVRVEAA